MRSPVRAPRRPPTQSVCSLALLVILVSCIVLEKKSQRILGNFVVTAASDRVTVTVCCPPQRLQRQQRQRSACYCYHSDPLQSAVLINFTKRQPLPLHGAGPNAPLTPPPMRRPLSSSTSDSAAPEMQADSFLVRAGLREQGISTSDRVVAANNFEANLGFVDNVIITCVGARPHPLSGSPLHTGAGPSAAGHPPAARPWAPPPVSPVPRALTHTHTS
jgi:hypothetical protein